MLLPRWKSSLRSYWPYYLLLIALIILCDQLWESHPRNWASLKTLIDSLHAKGDTARTDDYVRYWLPLMGRVHFYVFTVLLLVSPWLIGQQPENRPQTPTTNGSKWQWMLVGLAVISSFVLNVKRLDHSLWFDEEATVRRVIVGEVQEKNGVYDINTPTWTRTMFYYADPNNHPLFSLLARSSHTLFPPPQKPESFTFYESSVHLPGYLLSTLGLLVVFWMCCTMGSPTAGVLSVWWLALHPWFVRYGIDARGYCLLFLLVPLTLTCLWKAIQTCRLSWWIGFGLASFLTLWAYAGCLYLMMGINFAALGLIFLSGDNKWLQFRRYLAANCIGGALTSIVYAPCWQLMSAYLKRERSLGDITWHTVAEATTGLFTGIPMSKWEDHPLALSFARLWESHPAWVVFQCLVIAAVFAAGMMALWKSSSAGRLMFLPILLPAPLLLAVSIMKHNIIHPFYFVTSLPCLAIAMGRGIDFISQTFKQPARIATALVLIFGALSWQQNSILRRYPIEPMRESVEVMRSQRHPELGDMKSVLTAHVSFVPKVYDPAGVQVKNKADIDNLIAQARATKVPFYVNLGDLPFARMRYPDVMKTVEDPSLFEALPIFLGTDRQPSRMVYRLK